MTPEEQAEAAYKKALDWLEEWGTHLAVKGPAALVAFNNELAKVALAALHGTVRPANEALLAIQELLDGVEWSNQTLDEVAKIMIEAGYRIRDLDDVDRESEA